MEAFRRGETQILVATNIAARGLDVEHITHVISVDVPADPDDYVHRIGRTARAGSEGDAFLLVAPTEEKALAQIERQLGQRLPRVILPDFDYQQTLPERAGRPERRPRQPGSRPSASSRSALPAGAPMRSSGTPSPGTKDQARRPPRRRR